MCVCVCFPQHAHLFFFPFPFPTPSPTTSRAGRIMPRPRGPDQTRPKMELHLLRLSAWPAMIGHHARARFKRLNCSSAPNRRRTWLLLRVKGRGGGGRVCVCVRTREGAVGALASVFLDPLLTSIAPTRSFSSDDEAFFLTDSSPFPSSPIG